MGGFFMNEVKSVRPTAPSPLYRNDEYSSGYASIVLVSGASKESRGSRCDENAAFDPIYMGRSA